MRKVHDILTSVIGAKLSFIQHGNKEDGFIYETICPYCSNTVGYVDDREDFLTLAQIQSSMKALMREHIEKCQFPGAATLAVELTDRALNTEKLPEIM